MVNRRTSKGDDVAATALDPTSPQGGDDADDTPHVHGWGALIWCSCAAWWLGGDTDIAAHMHAHPRHVWWAASSYPDELPIGPPWPPRGDARRLAERIDPKRKATGRRSKATGSPRTRTR